MMQLIPGEIALGGVYFPPMLIAGPVGTAGAWLTALPINHYRLSPFFAYPPLVFLALAVIYTIAFGTFVIRERAGGEGRHLQARVRP